MSVSKILIIVLFIGVMLAVLKVQFLLSKKENKLYGLILPGFFFILSITMSLHSIPITATVENEMQTVSEDGKIVKSNNLESEEKFQLINRTEALFSASYLFVRINLFTIVLLTVYGICRRKRNIKNELKRMRIEEF